MTQNLHVFLYSKLSQFNVEGFSVKYVFRETKAPQQTRTSRDAIFGHEGIHDCDAFSLRIILLFAMLVSDHCSAQFETSCITSITKTFKIPRASQSITICYNIAILPHTVIVY